MIAETVCFVYSIYDFESARKDSISTLIASLSDKQNAQQHINQN